MLRLRTDQIMTLSAASLAPRVQVLLLAAFGPVALTLDRAFVVAAIRRAVAAGMATEQQVGRYVMLALVVRPDFETNPDTAWAHPVVTDRRMPPERKLSRLYALARRHGHTVGTVQSDRAA